MSLIRRQLKLSSLHERNNGEELTKFLSLIQRKDLIQWARKEEKRELRPDDTGKPPKWSKFIKNTVIGFLP